MSLVLAERTALNVPDRRVGGPAALGDRERRDGPEVDTAPRVPLLGTFVSVHGAVVVEAAGSRERRLHLSTLPLALLSASSSC